MKTNTTAPVIRRIAHELVRVAGAEVSIRMDADFEPEVGPLVEVAYDGAYWHLFPDDFLEMLRAMPRGAGGDAIREQIERTAHHVWHGPAPPSRDTTDTT